MRENFSFNTKWAFRKGVTVIPNEVPKDWDFVNLPHTWNAIDGQDGGNDYYRGIGCYMKELSRGELPCGERYYLEIGGANSSCDVYLNGKLLTHHDGGYSAFRVEITEDLGEENLFAVTVDNSPGSSVYPQVADFTFYGGLYRDVRIIAVSRTHFDLSYFGGQGFWVTPEESGNDYKLNVKASVTDAVGDERYRCAVYGMDGKLVSDGECESPELSLTIKNAHRWHGRRDPYLYTVRLELLRGGEIIDAVSDRIGCRSFKVDPERGFILNGEEYPLRGVSRHQDRWGIGNALHKEHYDEDMDLICEVGANTVRLAHYQHDRHFYDLCDERGMIVWAEIPYISQHLKDGTENTVSQMRELITQCYNHPSIAFWGLSNEITMKGDRTPELLENHRILNDLCHETDKTRLTTVAAVSPCPVDSPYLEIPDLVAYNHYFGWYGGDTSMMGPWFDEFHKLHPDIPIGCSEYGCEALNWHTASPEQGDYTEEYQAYYHEEMIRQMFSRRYIWATYVWNMFDFGADARGEGGENGQNHKGLVTFDRKYKKDAFYAYKAWLSDEPFVHIAGKRYVYRECDPTVVTVYSNLPEVELFANGKSVGKKKCEDHFFRFEVENKGETHLVAIAEGCKDESKYVKVEKFHEDYRLKEKGAILNWFDITEREGYLSLNSKISDIIATDEGRAIFEAILRGAKTEGGEFELNDGMMAMMGGFTLVRFASMASMVGIKLTKEELLSINDKLNRVKRL